MMTKNYSERKFKEIVGKKYYVMKLQVNPLAHKRTLCDYLVFDKDRVVGFEIKELTYPHTSLNKKRFTQIYEMSKCPFDTYFIICFRLSSTENYFFKISYKVLNEIFINKKSININDLSKYKIDLNKLHI